MVLEEVETYDLVVLIARHSFPKVEARIAIVPISGATPEGALSRDIEVLEGGDLLLGSAVNDLATSRLKVTALVVLIPHVVLWLYVEPQLVPLIKRV